MDSNEFELYSGLKSEQIITNKVNNNIIYKNYLDLSVDQIVKPDLEESLRQCTEAFDLITRNQYNKGLAICDKWSKHWLYHLHTKSLIYFIKAILTLETPEIEKATKVCEQTLEFCAKVRKTGAINGFFKSFYRQNYNNYSEEEVHSELIYAEQQLMIALITFFGDQSIVSLVKGAFRLRSGYLTYKECMIILETRKDWQSSNTRMHFESGTRLGVGAVNLVLSHLPQRVLKLLQFIGFSGDKGFGLQQLNQTVDNELGLRHFLAQLLLCSYECYLQQIFGLGKANLNRVEDIVNKELKKFDKSAWYLWFRGRLLQLNGQIDKAITIFEECLTVQDELKQLHNICFWELLWSHAVKCEWDSAASYASILSRQCHWSPATFAYAEASFLYMNMSEQDVPDVKKRISNLFKQVPKLKIRYAGKTIPPEKYCCISAEKYFKRNESLVLPAFELFYIWNIYSLLSQNVNLIKPMIKTIDKALDVIKISDSLKSDNNVFENYLMLLFMKGVCLKEMGLYSEAETHFEDILKNEKRIIDDTFIAPESALELGLTKLGLGSVIDAKYWLEKARKDYTGYPLETIIHFRVHCALQEIKSNTNNQKIQKQ